MSKKSKKFVLIFLGLAVTWFILSSVVSLFTQKSVKPQVPTPTPVSSDTPVEGVEYQIVTQEDLEQIERDRAVSALLDKVPYTGNDFSLTYSFTEPQFILALQAGREAEGSTEFDAFLKRNNVLNRSWIRNLTVQ